MSPAGPRDGARVVLRAALRRRLRPVLRGLTRADPGTPPHLRRGTGAPPPADAEVVVLVALLGATEASAADLLGVLRRAQWAHGALVPVVLVDTPVLQVFRRAGYVVELAAPGRTAEALAEARRTFVPDLVVVLADAAAPAAADALTAALLGVGAPPRRGPRRRLARRLLRRL